MDEPDVPVEMVERVLAACLALPEATHASDRMAYAFRIRRTVFAHLLAPPDPAGKPVPMVVVRADPTERDVLLSIGHPYFGPRSGGDRVGVLLGPDTDWSEIEELVTESYRLTAPKKLASLLDP